MKKISLLFFLVMFIIGTDTFLISPLLPTLTKAYQISPNISGWLISAYALGYATFALIAGPISDRLNRKKVMVIGLIAFTISTFLCGLAPNFWTMILFRLLAGVSASFVTPQVWASVPVLVPPKFIVRTMGYATAGLSIAQLIGIPIGSYLASFSWHMPFFVIALLSFILAFIIAFLLPDINPVTKKDSTLSAKSIFKIYKNLLIQPRATKYFSAYFLFQIGNYAAFSFIGSWFSKDFSLQVAGIGTAMIGLGLGSTIGSVFGSNLVRRIGESKSLLYSMVSLIILYAILPFAPTLFWAEVGFFINFLIVGLLFPVFMTTLQTLSASARGTVSALSNTAMYSATTIGAALGGILINQFRGFIGVAFFTVILYILSLLVYKSSGIFKNYTVQE
ncbi:MAG: MFS transporter [Clostridiaceae bacterium]